ncbi:MAG TPA: hypothetical protein VG297_15310 [Bryobacteraceae bacterium]|jgi:hypothetical protein|nr:hypothetical protein [Bryobacteraceae bacterium]
MAQPPALVRVIRQGAAQSSYSAGQARVNVLGMSAVAGPSERWLIELHDSFASIESADQALSAASLQPPETPLSADNFIAGARSLIATYRPGLSYRPEEGIRMFPKMRYLDVALLRIKPGNESDLGKLLRLRSVSLDSVNVDRPEIVYRVISGAPEGTYIVLAPMQSLRMLDSGRAAAPDYGEAADDAAKKIVAGIDLSREHFWFRVDPRQSYVSDEFAAQDPDFWRGNGR